MTADEPLTDEDDLTLAAGSDVLAQIREEALAFKRERTAEEADADGAEDADDEIVVWSADDESFDPSLDETSVLGVGTTEIVEPEIGEPEIVELEIAELDDVTEFASTEFGASHDPTVALDTLPVVTRRGPASTVARETHGDESLIGSALPPTTTATYFESSETGATMPEPVTARPRVRRRVPMWFLLLLAAVLIIGVSVVAALLVASGAST